MHGYACYEELKWNYCPYLHSDEVRNAYRLSQDRNVTAQALLEFINRDPEHSVIIKKCLRFIPEPPTVDEIRNIQFEIERKTEQNVNQNVNMKQQASSLRRKNKEKLAELKQ